MTESAMTQEQTKKPWYKKWWVIAIAAIIVIGVISSIINPAPKIAIPDLAGTPANEASESLKDLGFRVSLQNDERPVISGTDFDVESSTPAAGEEVREGSKVTLHVAEATERLAAEAAEAERVKEEEAAKKEAERLEAEQKRKAEAAEQAAGPVLYESARELCEAYANIEFPYGVKMHWLLERLANEQTESGWYLKVGATVTNAFNAERSYNVECHVSGTNGSPVMDDFVYY